MTHGTLNAYKHLGCRCDGCTEANRERSREERDHRAALDTPEQRRNCLICGTALSVHLIRACWREA